VSAAGFVTVAGDPEGITIEIKAASRRPEPAVNVAELAQPYNHELHSDAGIFGKGILALNSLWISNTISQARHEYDHPREGGNQ